MTIDHTQANNIHQSRIKGLEPAAPRKLQHRRTFCYEVYERCDGLWEIDAQMLDHKAHELTLANQVRAVGAPLHDTVLRLTIDNNLVITAVTCHTQSAPYMAHCPAINPHYQKMVGLNILQGFRKSVQQLFAGIQGCTHITEMANSLPTVAIQGISTQIAMRNRQASKEIGDSGNKPFQLGSCHALALDSEATQLYYPKWYEKPMDSE